MKSGRLSLMMRLLLSFCALLIVTIASLYIIFSDLSERNAIEQVQHNFTSILALAEEQLNERIKVLSEQTLNVMVNPSLFGQMSILEDEGYAIYGLLRTNVNDLLSSLFYRFPEVISAQILHENYSFAYRMRGSTNYQSIQRADVWQQIQDADGGIVWFPPDHGKYFTDSGDMRGNIWLARALNMTDIASFSRIRYRVGAKPVLVLCLKSGFLSEALLKSLGTEGAEYMLLDGTGKVFELEPTPNGEDWAGLSREIEYLDHQTEPGVYDDGKTIYCYVRSQATGWYHVIYMSQQSITGDMLRKMNGYILRMSALLMVAMLMISLVFSRVLSTPINKLIVAVKQLASGEFGQQIEYNGVNEMGFLIDRFNEMNLSIDRLIQENYQVKLREKDTEIMSLNIQFNPHYLYNTLNAIYWVAVRGGAKEAGNLIRSLSLMMRYTSDQKQEKTLLRDDVQWMKRYLYLMEARYGELFRTEWQLGAELEDMLVPKLFLQPLVENCILHAFKDMDTGGLIVIRGWEERDALAFSVEDNGCGIGDVKLDAACVTEGQANIGLANVHRRIQLICGPEYGLEIEPSAKRGTTIIIKMSKESETK